MVEFRCADAGTVCPALLQASSQDELMRQVADHLKRDHRVKTPNRTILNYMGGLVRPAEEPASAGRRAR